jgi:protein-S-isoprenylcysteine O-methyltransferase Ste14
MTPALRNFFALIVAIAALTAVNFARYGTGWAWASLVIGIVALASGLYLLISFWRSNALGRQTDRPAQQ